MEYHDPPLQPAGSMDCEFYAAAYLARLFGHDVSVETLRQYKEHERRDLTFYLVNTLGMPLSWGLYWQVPHKERFDYMWANREGYKPWVLREVAKGAIGFAVIHLVPQCGHCVVILEADEECLLIADSVRGLVKDSWEKHLTHDDRYFPSRVEAWFSRGV